MSFVVDRSVALSWCFEDERTPATKALLERVGERGAVAPQHWPLEVLNGLLMAERRQLVDTGKRRQLADFLRDLPITLDPDTTVHIWGAAQRGRWPQPNRPRPGDAQRAHRTLCLSRAAWGDMRQSKKDSTQMNTDERGWAGGCRRGAVYRVRSAV